jgi:hypothetical protein
MRVADFAAMFNLWRAGDEVASSEYSNADGVYQEAGKEPVVGRDRIAERWGKFFHGGHEWRFNVRDIFGGGENFAVTYIWEFKSKYGSWDHKPGCALVKARDGNISEWRQYSG